MRSVPISYSRISACVSMVSDVLIVGDVSRSRQRRRLTHNRILVAMSVCDFVVNVFKFLSTWLNPERGRWGTPTTCQVQGVFVTFGLVVPAYHVVVTINYLLLVHYDVSPRAVQDYYEKPMIAIPFTACLANALAGVVPGMDLYNPGPSWCFVYAWPRGCDAVDDARSEVDCARGEDARLFQALLFYAWIWLFLVFDVVAFAVIYLGVRDKESAVVGLFSSRVAAFRRSRRVRTQALCFIGAYVVAWGGASLRRALSWATDGRSRPYGLAVVHAVCTPLQGFLNMLVYFRPRAQEWLSERRRR